MGAAWKKHESGIFLPSFQAGDWLTLNGTQWMVLAGNADGPIGIWTGTDVMTDGHVDMIHMETTGIAQIVSMKPTHTVPINYEAYTSTRCTA